jgi:hypothetical protein
MIGVGLATAAGAVAVMAVAALGAPPLEAVFAAYEHAMCAPVVEVPPATLLGARGVACAPPAP